MNPLAPVMRTRMITPRESRKRWNDFPSSSLSAYQLCSFESAATLQIAISLPPQWHDTGVARCYTRNVICEQPNGFFSKPFASVRGEALNIWTYYKRCSNITADETRNSQ